MHKDDCDPFLHTGTMFAILKSPGTTPVQPPLQALRFSHGRGERETRVTGDEPQGTMGRVKTAGEAPARSCVVILAKQSFSGHGPIWVFLSLGSDQF